MSLDKLIADGSIHPFKATSKEIARSMQLARRDLDQAKRILPESPSKIMWIKCCTCQEVAVRFIRVLEK
jgi:hypothetical protein